MQKTLQLLLRPRGMPTENDTVFVSLPGAQGVCKRRSGFGLGAAIWTDPETTREASGYGRGEFAYREALAFVVAGDFCGDFLLEGRARIPAHSG